MLSKSTADTLEERTAASLNPDNTDSERVSEWIRGATSTSSQWMMLEPFSKRSPKLFASVAKTPETLDEKKGLFTNEKIASMAPGSPRVKLFEHLLEEVFAFYNDNLHLYRNFWEHNMYRGM